MVSPVKFGICSVCYRNASQNKLSQQHFADDVSEYETPIPALDIETVCPDAGFNPKFYDCGRKIR